MCLALSNQCWWCHTIFSSKEFDSAHLKVFWRKMKCNAQRQKQCYSKMFPEVLRCKLCQLDLRSVDDCHSHVVVQHFGGFCLVVESSQHGTFLEEAPFAEPARKKAKGKGKGGDKNEDPAKFMQILTLKTCYNTISG